MPTTTTRLALPRPVATDPDNVPGDLTSLTDLLDLVVLDRRGGDTITASGATVVPLVVKGAAAHNANMLEARDDAAALRAVIDKDGNVGAKQVFVGGTIGQSLGAALSIVNPNGTTNPCLVVRGMAAQTANLAEYQNSSGTVLSTVSAAGQGFFTNGASTVPQEVVLKQQKNTGTIPNGGSETQTFAGLFPLSNFSVGAVYRLFIFGRNINTGTRYAGEITFCVQREGGAATVNAPEVKNLQNGVGTGGTAVNIGFGVTEDGSSLLINVGNATGGGLQANLSLRIEDSY